MVVHRRPGRCVCPPPTALSWYGGPITLAALFSGTVPTSPKCTCSELHCCPAPIPASWPSNHLSQVGQHCPIAHPASLTPAHTLGHTHQRTHKYTSHPAFLPHTLPPARPSSACPYPCNPLSPEAPEPQPRSPHTHTTSSTMARLLAPNAAPHQRGAHCPPWPARRLPSQRHTNEDRRPQGPHADAVHTSC